MLKKLAITALLLLLPIACFAAAEDQPVSGLPTTTVTTEKFLYIFGTTDEKIRADLTFEAAGAVAAHAGNISNPHAVTKSQVGLSLVENIKHAYAQTIAPPVTADSSLGYVVGKSLWLQTTGEVWVCTDATAGAAEWKRVGVAVSSINCPEGEVVNAFNSNTGAFTCVAGASGTDGLSAYEVAVASGFSGTEQEWLDSLVSTVPGPPGANGTDGQDGADSVVPGPPGYTPIKDIDYFDGEQGIQGLQGLPGAEGPQGIQGEIGPQGIQGIAGADGLDGATGPQGEIGPQGPAGIDGSAGATGLQGIQGEPGPQGIQGIAGADGADGYTPVLGTDYFNGVDGATGPQGEQGVQGIQGEIGPQGIQGIAGTDGADSTVPGPQGEVGPQGIQGLTGEQGIQGIQGEQGIQGVPGDPATDDQTAAEVPITDTGLYFTGTDIEAALQEIGPTMTDARAPTSHNNTAHSEAYLTTETDAIAASALSDHVGAADPHPGYVLPYDLGDSAPLDVGTTDGTVAAGDDGRLSLGGIDIRSYSCTADGVADDTTCLNNAIAASQAANIPLVIRPLANGNKVFLTDSQSISSPTTIVMTSGSTLKMRPDNLTPGTTTAVLTFTTGSDGSILSGNGILDGNRDNAKAAFTTGHWSALRIYNSSITIKEGITLQEATTASLYCSGGSNYVSVSDVTIKNSAAGALFYFVDKLDMKNVTITNIDNEGVATYQHGLDLWACGDAKISGLNILDSGGDASGSSAWFSGVTIVDSSAQISDLLISGFIANGVAPIKPLAMSLMSSEIQGTNWRIVGVGFPSLEIATGTDFTLDGFFFDNEYLEYAGLVDLSGSIGITIDSYGYSQVTPDSTVSLYKKSTLHSRNVKLSNGVVRGHGTGITVASGNVILTNVTSTGNSIDGIDTRQYGAADSFPYAPEDTDYLDITLLNCNATYNGYKGLDLLYADRLNILGGRYDNNGQDSALAATSRVGIGDAAGGSIGTVTINGVYAGDTQSGTQSGNASMDWSAYIGGYVSGDVIELDAADQHLYYPGQNVTVGGVPIQIRKVDVRGTIHAVTTGAGSYPTTTTAGTGTITSSGVNISGVGTALNTELNGRYWIVANGQYRRIVEATTATAAKVESAFSPDVSAVAFTIVKLDVVLIPSQQHGIYLTNATDVKTGLVVTSGNVTAESTITNKSAWVGPLDLGGTGYVGDGAQCYRDDGTWAACGTSFTGDATAFDITVADSATAIKSGNYAVKATSGVADSATATGFLFDVDNELTTNGAQLVNFTENGTSFFSVNRLKRFGFNYIYPSYSFTFVENAESGSTTPAMFIANNMTNQAQGKGSIGIKSYLTAEEPAALLYALSSGTGASQTSNIIYWGGGSSAMNAATRHSFFAAATATTTTGTEIARVNITGLRVEPAGVTADATAPLDVIGNGIISGTLDLQGGAIVDAADTYDVDTGTDTTMGAIRDAALAVAASVSTSAGAGDSGKHVKLNASGLIDSTMLPAGSATSGTYTPTFTNTTNIDSSSANGTWKWTRIGTFVTVWGVASIDPTSSGSGVTIGISFPTASAIALDTDVVGNCVISSAPGSATTTSGNIFGDVTNDRATMEFVAPNTTAYRYAVHFSYEVQ
jgi:hypothetical protein